jgi:hypothetical protein
MTQRTGSQTERGQEPRGRRRLGFVLPVRRVGGEDAEVQSAQTPDLAEIGVRLIDDAYLAWLTAARDSECAMAAWSEGRDSYWAYRAALDREEAAARDFERLSDLARPCRDALVT